MPPTKEDPFADQVTCAKLRQMVLRARDHAITNLTPKGTFQVFVMCANAGTHVEIRTFSGDVNQAMRDARALTGDAGPWLDSWVIACPVNENTGGNKSLQAGFWAHERGAPKLYRYSQPVEPAAWWHPARPRGGLLFCERVNRAGSIAEPEEFVEACGTTPGGLLTALRMPETRDAALKRLFVLDRAALDALVDIGRADACSIVQAFAAELDKLRRLQEGDTAGGETEAADRAGNDHAAEALLSILELRDRVNRLRQRRAAAPRPRVVARALTGPVGEFWDRLSQCGWLEWVPVGDRGDLQARLLDAHAKDPTNTYLGLAPVALDDWILCDVGEADPEAPPDDGSLRELLQAYMNASYGQFRPTDLAVDGLTDPGGDVDASISRCAFRVNRHRIRFAARWKTPLDALHRFINDGAAASGPARFFFLPGTDRLDRLVYVPPDVYERARAAGVIPSKRPGGRSLRRLDRAEIPGV